MMGRNPLEFVLVLDKDMATFFRTKVIKDIGTQKIVVFEVPATNATVIGPELSKYYRLCSTASVLIKDDEVLKDFM